MSTLHDYNTGAVIRTATAEELAASIEAAKHDGGAGVIIVDVFDDGEETYCYAME
jgi:1,4-dihydroxy-2-naphthoyl-CoA synthase